MFPLRLLLSFVSLTLLPLAAQNIPFQLLIRQQGNLISLPNNATLNVVASGIGRPITTTVTATYTGTTAVVLSGGFQVAGSTAFKSTSTSAFPINLGPGGSFSFDITYDPIDRTTALGQIAIAFLNASAVTGTPGTAGTILINTAGTVPDIAVNYALQTNGNIIQVSDGGTIPFGQTPVNTIAGATIFLLNRGSGAGSVESVTLTGDTFQLISLPFLPNTVAPGNTLQFGLRYSPQKLGSDTGTLVVKFASATLTFTLQGSSTGTQFAYDLVSSDSGARSTIQPNQTVPLADTDLGARSTYSLQVRNTGNAQGAVNVITVSGTGYALADLPFLPAPLGPNEVLTFTLVFAPTTIGKQTGRLRIGNDVFDITGNGLGSKLTYSYSLGSSNSTILSPGTLLFTPIAAGQTSVANFQIRNDGTIATRIVSIGIGGNPGPYRVDQLPSLPLQLAPGASASFNVYFSPITIGLINAQLVVDTQSFTLSGFGTAPPPLPAYSFTGASGTQEPFQQPSFRLNLADRYPLDLQGTLVLTIDPDVSSVTDPAVQFSTGGRTVLFTIPANTTAAIFSTGQPDLKLQTGTVAGTISATPTFATASGIVLTPATKTALQISVPRRAPRITNLQITGITASGFTIQVTGYSSTRNLLNAAIQFTGAPGVTISTSQFNVSVQNLAFGWYQSSTSAAVGSQFTLTLPFSFQRTASTTRLTDEIQSVKVTLSNDIGTSSSLAVNLLNVNLP